MYGLGGQVAFDAPGGVSIGFGSEPSDLGVGGVRRALDKARRAAVHDPEWRSLPPAASQARTPHAYPDPRLLAVSDVDLVEAGLAGITREPRTRIWLSRV